MIVGVLEALFTIDSSKYTSGIKAVESSTNQAEKSINSAGTSLIGFKTKLAAVGVTALAVTSKLVTTAMELEGIEHKMRFATGGIEGAREAFSYLGNEADRLGVSLEVLSTEYGNFAASSKSTSLSTKEMQAIFSSVSEAAAVLRMDATATKLSFKALGQMMSKGAVQAEELKMQLGDHLPGAVQLMAKSLGVSVKELNKMMEAGELLAEEVLPKFAKTLSEEVAPSLDDLDQSLSAAVGRMQSAWFELKRMIMDEGSIMSQSLKMMINTATGFMKAVGGIKAVFTEGVDSGSFMGTTTIAQELNRLTVVAEENAAEVIKIEKEKQEAIYQFEAGAVQRRLDLKQESFEKEKSIAETNSAAVVAVERKNQKELDKARYAGIQERAKAQDEAFEIEKKFFEERHSDVLGFFESTLDTTLGMMQSWATGGKINFKDFSDSIIKDMTAIVFKAMVAKPLMDSLRGFLDASEQGAPGVSSMGKGGFFSKIAGFLGSAVSGGMSGGGGGFQSSVGTDLGGGRVKAFASGGIIDEPVAGIGLDSGTKYSFGEEGEEAVVPLTGRTESTAAFRADSPKSEEAVIPPSGRTEAIVPLSGRTEAVVPLSGRTESATAFQTNSPKGASPFDRDETDNGYSYGKGVMNDNRDNSDRRVVNETKDNSDKSVTNNSTDQRVTNNNNVNVSISALDSKSLTDLMRENPQAVTIPIIDAMQGGDRGLTAAMRGTI